MLIFREDAALGSARVGTTHFFFTEACGASVMSHRKALLFAAHSQCGCAGLMAALQ